MLASAGQASDEHPLRQTPHPEPVMGLGAGAEAALV